MVSMSAFPPHLSSGYTPLLPVLDTQGLYGNGYYL
jgi:hypothetical protein